MNEMGRMRAVLWLLNSTVVLFEEKMRTIWQRGNLVKLCYNKMGTKYAGPFEIEPKCSIVSWAANRKVSC